MKETILLASLSLALSGASAMASAEETDRQDASSVAAALANPNTNIGSLQFNLDWVAFDGDLPDADKQYSTKLSFQPSLPYKINKNTNFFFRPNVPLVMEQPKFDSTTGRFQDTKTGLGDISFDAAFGRTFSNGLILVGGVAGTLPTATRDDLGNDQFLIGPEFAVATFQPWGVIGGLFSHQWNAGGSNDESTSITAGQYFYTFNLGDGWQIQSQPTWSYNHNADSGERLTLPVGFGIAKTSIIGGRPYKIGVQYWNYVEQADTFGPKHQIRFVFTPVVALPW